MSVEHKDITDNNIHEPKGCSTATANRVYVANGAGTGSWKKIDTTALQGVDGDSGVAGKHLVTDGSNGVKFVDALHYGNMAVTDNGNTFSMTAVADTTFNTASQFTLLTGSGSPWSSELLDGVTFSTDRLTVDHAGVYKIEAYLNIGAFPSSTAKLAMRYRINGTTYSSRKPTIKSSGATAEGQLIGFGIVTLAANDYVQLTVASDTTGSALFKDINVIVTMVKHG